MELTDVVGEVLRRSVALREAENAEARALEAYVEAAEHARILRKELGQAIDTMDSVGGFPPCTFEETTHPDGKPGPDGH